MIVSLSLEKLIQAFNRFPGIGRKTAQRLAWFLIGQDSKFALELAETIRTAIDSVQTCRRCNIVSESDPCPFCQSPDRNDDVICVIESSPDTQIIENMNDFRGRYFVLGHLLSPLDGYGPEQIHCRQLVEFINEIKPQEVILALKPSAEGEATIHYISEILSETGVRITRLSTGLPFGGDLEYSSTVTLANAWKRRYSV